MKKKKKRPHFRSKATSKPYHSFTPKILKVIPSIYSLPNISYNVSYEYLVSNQITPPISYICLFCHTLPTVSQPRVKCINLYTLAFPQCKRGQPQIFPENNKKKKKMNSYHHNPYNETFWNHFSLFLLVHVSSGHL